MLARSHLIESSSRLLVTRTGIKAWSSSILGQIRPLILELPALEWRKFHTFELEYLLSQLASLNQILCVASLGWGKGCIRFWGRLDQNCFSWQQKTPLTYIVENDETPFLCCYFIRSFLYLQVMRTCIKSRTSLNLSQIGPLPTELAALEVLKNSHRLTMGKWCLHASSFILDQIIIKVAANQDRHKSLDEFDFRPLVSMAHLSVFWNEIWPWHIGLRWAIIGLLGYLFSNLQVTTTGINSWKSSNFSQFGPLPTELGALEHLKNFPST